MWKSQIQTKICLRSTESEYIALSQALHRTIPIIDILKQMNYLGYNVGTASPTVPCKFFEGNSRDLTLALALSMRPRTKHINVKYHHLC